MIYLIQILKMLNETQRKDFLALFSDLEYELDELGWRGDETTLINDMLFNHFGLAVDDQNQLQMLTDSILKPRSLKAAINMVGLKSQCLNHGITLDDGICRDCENEKLQLPIEE